MLPPVVSVVGAHATIIGECGGGGGHATISYYFKTCIMDCCKFEEIYIFMLDLSSLTIYGLLLLYCLPVRIAMCAILKPAGGKFSN